MNPSSLSTTYIPSVNLAIAGNNDNSSAKAPVKTIKEYLFEHEKRIKKQLSERSIQTHSGLEAFVKTLPFGKEGLHQKARQELEELTEEIICNDIDSKIVKITRHGFLLPPLFEYDTAVFVTFSPDKWIYHAIYRKNKGVPYHANDLFRFNFLRAETIAQFNIRWPKEIIIGNITNIATLEKVKSLDMRTPSGVAVFLNDTPLGKHITRVFDEFGFVIESFDTNSHLICESYITIGVKPAL